MDSTNPGEPIDVPSPPSSLRREPDERWCLKCGESWRIHRSLCPLCYGKLTNSKLLPPKERPGFTFSLSTLMLVMTLACVLTWSIVSLPVAGIVAAFFVILALMDAARRHAKGYRRQVEHPLREFFLRMGYLTVWVVGGVLTVLNILVIIYCVDELFDRKGNVPKAVSIIIPSVFTLRGTYLLYKWASRRLNN